ncbi:MAG TPA: hypothetical protein DCK93_01380 [Blastocatellia bacterium]|jgi:hypothetical protein|nr:hypothetical protein [Blastocatellia bacterium]HAF21554.1 hypothetical protein [Blastocatellia bacterium]
MDSRAVSQQSNQVKGAVFAFLIDHCLSLRAATAADIERAWQMTTEAAYEAGIRSCPTEIENLIASGSCRDRFGDEVLKTIDRFYKFDRLGSECLCLEWRRDCVCHLQTWRLDIDPELADRGLIVPAREAGRIIFLQVFRHARDLHPFRFRLREAA